MKIDKRVRFDEKYIDEDNKTTTLYFLAEKSLLEELFPGKYPESESMEISLKFPTESPAADNVDISVSPTKDGEDYDWTDIELPHEEIKELLKLEISA